MFCSKCGAQTPEDSLFCNKCGTAIYTAIAASTPSAVDSARNVILAPSDAKVLKCPSCGAPLTPLFGEMVITCSYCGSSVNLGSQGWKSIGKHSMLALKVTDRHEVERVIRDEMNNGLLRIRVHERSNLEEMNLTFVPYWILSVSARTNIVAADTARQVGTAAASAALFGAIAGGGRHSRGGGVVEGALLGSMMSGGFSGGMIRSYQMSDNYNYPVIALKALTDYQPHDFQFDLRDRILFSSRNVPSEVKILNGDISEDDAKQIAKILVDQLQSRKAHEKYHMIQQINSVVNVGEAELVHVPVWAARYDFKGKKIVVVVDGNSGDMIHSVGLD